MSRFYSSYFSNGKLSIIAIFLPAFLLLLSSIIHFHPVSTCRHLYPLLENLPRTSKLQKGAPLLHYFEKKHIRKGGRHLVDCGVMHPEPQFGPHSLSCLMSGALKWQAAIWHQRFSDSRLRGLVPVTASAPLTQINRKIKLHISTLIFWFNGQNGGWKCLGETREEEINRRKKSRKSFF